MCLQRFNIGDSHYGQLARFQFNMNRAGQPMQILVVEDDKTSRLVLHRILESTGDLEIIEATDGVKAWELLDGGLHPALCFLDINMPKLNGLELLERIRGGSISLEEKCR